MRRAHVAAAFLIAGLLGAASSLAAEPPLTLERKITLGAVKGRIDHLAIDLKRQRLLIAELGNDSVGVVDLAAGKLSQRIDGLREPQGVAYASASDEIYVANAANGAVDVFSASGLARIGELKLGADADNIRVSGDGRVFVGYGDGAIAVLDGGKKIADLPLAAHPESFQLDTAGGRIFVNEPEAQRVGVVDGRTGKELAKWGAPDLRQNFPIAYDPAGRQLLVAYRDPPKLVAFDAADGKVRSQTATCGDADDVFLDAKRRRVYVSCGAGVLAVLSVADGRLTETATIETRKGARTSLFVPELDRLFLAVRAEASRPAELWVFAPH